MEEQRPVANPITRRNFLAVASAAAALVVAHGRSRGGGLFAAEPATVPVNASMLMLSDGWLMQSSEAVKEPGGRLSTADYAPKGWYSVTVPCTVLAGQVVDLQ